MIRKIAAIFAGLIVGALLLTAFEYLIGKIYPFTGDIRSREVWASYTRNMPGKALMLLFVSKVVMSFISAAIAGRISQSVVQPMVVGFLFMTVEMLNLLVHPHPFWMAIVLLLPYMPSAWMGARAGLGDRR